MSLLSMLGWSARTRGGAKARGEKPSVAAAPKWAPCALPPVFKTELHVTLWPSFPHFGRFSQDERLAGIRLNSAMMDNPELENELGKIASSPSQVPLFFDVKGRQPRVTEIIPNRDHLDMRVNHPMTVNTPCTVLFKAGADAGLLDHLEEGGTRLVFKGGPRYKVKPGESFCIREPGFRIGEPLFTDAELSKIEKVRNAGFKRYYLSYVEEASDVDRFMELVGKDCEVWLKIETMGGLRYVAKDFKKRDNLTLVAARGDLFVEIDRPHRMPQALRLIIEKDPEACVGSRLLLSMSEGPIPSCADFLEMAWLYDVGYRRMLLCDELCLKEEPLANAVNAFDIFKRDYT